jgi:hypothetical protein
MQAWTGDAAGVEASVAADRVYRKPVLNTENGYEYLSGYATNKKQVHHTNKVRRAAWRIVCSGGYVAAVSFRRSATAMCGTGSIRRAGIRFW